MRLGTHPATGGEAKVSIIYSAGPSLLHRRSAMKALKKSAVLYHYPCPDGAFAALAAHLYFSATSQPVLFFPNTVYDPIRYFDTVKSTFHLIRSSEILVLVLMLRYR